MVVDIVPADVYVVMLVVVIYLVVIILLDVENLVDALVVDFALVVFP